MITLRMLRRLSAAALPLGALALPLCATADAVAPGLADAAEWCPLVPDRLYAAAETDVDLARMRPDEPTWRANCRALYRSDDRPPAVVFTEGLRPADTHGQYDLRSYAQRDQPAPYVAATYDREAYRRQDAAYHYWIDAPGGIDVNATIGTRAVRAPQTSVAFPGGIARQFVVKACPVDPATRTEATARCVFNPDYAPWRGWPAPAWTGVPEPGVPAGTTAPSTG
ncbi:hypothetical protein ACFYXS_08565 [Streptomyces sp. NPDC002574]|uniref:scabin-related ADP-ribosyltransferase n=1 Tax=Streptomyces sp. NPDC002574 TaxID=3364652 RepID=UPI0036906CDC